MKKYLSTQPFLSSLLLNLLLFLVCYCFLWPQYGTSDDTEMQLITSGLSVAPQASPWLRWTHCVPGHLLYALYQLAPSVSWYGCYVYSAHFMGLTACLYVILRLQADYWRVLIYLLLFLGGETALLQEVQFTSTAIILGIGGSMLLFLAMRTQTGWQWLGYSLGGLMVLWASMIRWQCFLLVMLLVACLLLYGIFERRVHWQKRILPLLIIVGLCFLTRFAGQKVQQQQPGWQEFFIIEDAGVNHELVDFRNRRYGWTPQTAKFYADTVGWSFNDFRAYYNWFWADTSVYNGARFQLIRKHCENRPFDDMSMVRSRWHKFFIKKPIIPYYYLGLLVPLLGLFFMPRQRWIYFTIIASYLAVTGLMLMLISLRYLPERVGFPAIFYLSMLSALFWGWQHQTANWAKMLGALLLLILAIPNLKMVLDRSVQTRENQQQWDLALAQLNPQDNQLYIGAPCRFQEPVAAPLRNLDNSPLQQFHGLDFGHLANVPTFYQQLHHFGLQNIHTQAINNPNVFFIHGKYTDYMDIYAAFVKEHYGQEIRFELLHDFEHLETAIYQIKNKKL